MEFQKFIRKPDITMVAGIKVTKETELTYENEHVKQTLKDLVFHSVTKVKGINFESVYDTTIELSEGEILVFEEEGRGYIKPVEEFMTVPEAIEELSNIQDLV
jgi:hypothetical protein